MSTRGPAGGPSAGEPPQPQPQPPVPALAGRMGYLLKHAQLRMAELNAAALAPFGITRSEERRVGKEC